MARKQVTTATSREGLEQGVCVCVWDGRGVGVLGGDCGYGGGVWGGGGVTRAAVAFD